MVCRQITIEDTAPTLYIKAMDAIENPASNVPEHNRYGVGLGILVEGTGRGNLKIDWGNDHSETKTGLIQGYYEFKQTLPPGTHDICCVLFNLER